MFEPDVDLLLVAAARAEESARELFEELGTEIDYAAYSDDISLEEFSRLFRLAMLDLFSDRSLAEKAEKLECLPEEIRDWREEPIYERLKADVLARFKKLATPKKFKDHLDDVDTQDRVAKAMRRRAVTAKNPSVAQRAADSLAARYAPVVTKQVSERRVLIRREDLLLLVRAEAELAEKDPKLVEGIRKELPADTEPPDEPDSLPREEAPSVEEDG